jgi:predicted ArsR family transcriptional regulator
VGRSVAAAQGPIDKKSKLERRVESAAQVLNALGGNPRLEKEGNQLVISSTSCPLSAVVAEHPETCQMVESLVSDLVGAKVHENCVREESPQCRFTISKSQEVGKRP